MTDRVKQNKKIKDGLTKGQLLFCVMSIVALVLTFFYSDVAISSMSNGMRLCVGTVIPSLFPFMIFSELFVSSGAAELVSRLLGRPISRIFGISKEGSCAVLLGFLCGFPIGTKAAISLYERSCISKKELEHICAFCNNPSSAFLIGAVGITLFGSKSFGLVLYITHLISSSLVGIISGIYYRSKSKEKSEEIIWQKKPKCDRFTNALADAVKGSAQSMLFICAFVIFFSAVVGYLQFFCDMWSVKGLPRVLLFGLVEMTGGVASTLELPLKLAAPIAAMISGWSGLSVHFQLVGICREHKISLKPYLLSKLACSFLNFALISLFLHFFWDRLCLSEGGSMSSLPVKSYTPWALSVLFVFAFACLWQAGKRRK